MFTNELKKGDRVKLRNGWDAKIEDNLKGNTRLCTVYGDFTEMGSVYSHDIMFKYEDGGKTTKMEYTPAQEKCRAMNRSLFG
jgi:hypothetical protein